VVGAVEQELAEQCAVTGDEAGAQARQVGALRQAVEHHAAGKIVAAELGAGLKQARRGVPLVRVDLRVALVAGDDEVVGVGEGDQSDRKSTHLNSSHVKISYAVFCLKKK